MTNSYITRLIYHVDRRSIFVTDGVVEGKKMCNRVGEHEHGETGATKPALCAHMLCKRSIPSVGTMRIELVFWMRMI